MRVMAWQMAHLIVLAPGGSWRGIWQLEQFTSINMAATSLNSREKWKGPQIPRKNGRVLGLTREREDRLYNRTLRMKRNVGVFKKVKGKRERETQGKGAWEWGGEGSGRSSVWMDSWGKMRKRMRQLSTVQPWALD